MLAIKLILDLGTQHLTKQNPYRVHLVAAPETELSIRAHEIHVPTIFFFQGQKQTFEL